MTIITRRSISDGVLAGRLSGGSAPFAFPFRLLRAWATLEPRHWSGAAESWLALCAILPPSAGKWRRAAWMLRLSERYEDALAALDISAGMVPPDASMALEQGRILRALGRREEAIAAWEAAWRMGGQKAAGALLCRYGARDCVPEVVDGIVPNRDYPAFLQAHPVGPPPSRPATPHFRIWVTGGEDRPGAEADTIRSLNAQSFPHHSVRIAHHEGEAGTGGPDIPDDAGGDQWQIVLPAGVRLHREALAWLAFAIGQGECGTVYTDSDHMLTGPEGAGRAAPVFHPMPDDLWFRDPASWPVFMASRSPHGRPGAGAFVTYADWASLPAPIVHVPRILATQTCGGTLPGRRVSPPVRAGQPGTLSVIIPTRDNPALLAACVQSLNRTADDVGRLDIRIVDNGSIREDMRRLLDDLRQSGAVADVIPFPEPFNWSRANNIAADTCKGDGLLFLNDDTEMLAKGWDSHIVGLMSGRTVGAIGARMLYPDRRVQHAGFVFGMDDGPQHEGRWMPEEAPGPDDRWIGARRTVAVTGGFMAMSRHVFDLVGPFDEKGLAIDYSDIDWCLRARAAGLDILYSPDLLLLHHESASRGFNRSRARKRRVRREASTLRMRWGGELDRDPGYNPHWTRKGAPFDGVREPPLHEILRYIEQSGTINPLRVSGRPGSGGNEG